MVDGEPLKVPKAMAPFISGRCWEVDRKVPLTASACQAGLKYFFDSECCLKRPTDKCVSAVLMVNWLLSQTLRLLDKEKWRQNGAEPRSQKAARLNRAKSYSWPPTLTKSATHSLSQRRALFYWNTSKFHICQMPLSALLHTHFVLFIRFTCVSWKLWHVT